MRGKIYFGPQVQRFQAIMVERVWWSRATPIMVAIKERERERERERETERDREERMSVQVGFLLFFLSFHLIPHV
jgi:hypothetical protein